MVLDSIRVQYCHYLTVAWEKNAIIFGVDRSSSVHIDNKKLNIELVFQDQIENFV